MGECQLTVHRQGTKVNLCWAFCGILLGRYHESNVVWRSLVRYLRVKTNKFKLNDWRTKMFQVSWEPKSTLQSNKTTSLCSLTGHDPAKSHKFSSNKFKATERCQKIAQAFRSGELSESLQLENWRKNKKNCTSLVWFIHETINPSELAQQKKGKAKLVSIEMRKKVKKSRNF